MGRMTNFFQIRKKRAKKDYLLALDIGTEFVKALIFKANKNEGLVVGVGRQRQLPNHMQAGAVADIDGVALTCQKAIEQAAQIARLKPNQAVIGIAGEFIKGLTTNFAYQRNQPETEIDLAELKNIIQKIQWKAFDQIRSQLAWETGQPEIEIRLVNALVNEVRIDGYQVTKRISKTLGLSLVEAEAIKIKHAQQQLSQGVQRKIREILEGDIKIWSKGIELILEEFNQAEFFPPLILLCGGGSLLPGIKNILRRESVQGQWLNKFPFTQKPKIRFIHSDQINNIIDQTKTLKGPENITPLALANLTLEIATSEEKALSSILRRIVRMMR